MERKYTQKELDNICKFVNNIVKTIVEKCPNHTEEIVNHKKLLLKCETVDSAVLIINKILELQLDYMSTHPELYLKYVSKKE